jgi:hypothetical protein
VHQVRSFWSVLLLLTTGVNGATLVFSTNPLAGVPDTGGQIVNGAGGGPVFSFNPLTDVIAFDPAAFGVNAVAFANGNTTDPGFPMSGLTVAVVQNAAAARAVATVLGNQLTSTGPGFFMYFNAGLNVPRLVFSRDLGDPNADLAILARFDNLTGQAGVLPSIQASNFTATAIPEPSSMLITSGALAAGCLLALFRRR